MKILLTGATGYVGGRLLKALEQRGQSVRCIARKPEFLVKKVRGETEVVAGDALRYDTLPAALTGIDVAYYLVHSMGSAGAFEEDDRIAATNFGRACAECGVGKIIYLGGLGDDDRELSSHLKSRHEVGKILRESKVPVIEFRASIVIGSGSLSFELVRALTERLPVMIAPRWVSVPTQPIAIEDIISYLVAAASLQMKESRILEIGGTDVVSYGEIIKEYARQRGLKRVIISVPVLTPRLSSLWLGLVTPIYARVGRKLIESLRYPTVVRNTSALDVMEIRPRGIREAIKRALENEEHEFAVTRWSDALSSAGPARSWGGRRFGTRIVDSRTMEVALDRTASFAPVRRIGGNTGWYYADWLWAIRGSLDLLSGGPGLRRGRRNPESLMPGDHVDFWRVEAFEADRYLLKLASEMHLPGRAWLEFEVTRTASGSMIRQTAIFDPLGLSGLLYWYLLYPLHQLVFAGMLRNICRTAVEEAKDRAA
jgi:uncharacterized protein YbjT (DUF2867 family)